MSGMKISQRPPEPRDRIGLARPSQWLKLPTTLTSAGRWRAQTEEVDAPDAFVVDQVGAELLKAFAEVRPLGEQVQVEFGEHRPEAIGVDEVPRVALVILEQA